MFDTLVAASFVIIPFIGLITDYIDRSNYQKLINKNICGDHELHEGIIVSDEPLIENVNGKKSEVAIKKETLYSTRKIENALELGFYLSNENYKFGLAPLTFNTIWNIEKSAIYFNDELKLFPFKPIVNINKSIKTITIYPASNVDIEWRYKVTENNKNNTIIEKNMYFNNDPCTIFGRKSGDKMIVKYMGGYDYVTNKVKHEHYHIDDSITAALVGSLLISGVYLINKLNDDN